MTSVSPADHERVTPVDAPIRRHSSRSRSGGCRGLRAWATRQMSWGGAELPAVDDDVAGRHPGREVVDGLAGRVAGGNHHPYSWRGGDSLSIKSSSDFAPSAPASCSAVTASGSTS